jgi:MYXO-CTERM domain-containing protein
MKSLFWIGLVVLILGIASFFVPIPGRQRDTVEIGGLSLGIQTHHDEKASPLVGAVLVLAGAGLLVAGRRRNARRA